MRRGRRAQNPLKELVAVIERMELVEVLRPVAAELRPAINFLIAAQQAGSTNVAEIEQCARIHLLALKQLPANHEVTPRFLFDAYLIQSFAAELRGSHLPIPSMVLPRYNRPWCFRHVLLGPASAHNNPAVDVIGFRGASSLDEVHLLDYAWLAHELGHSAFKANSTEFAEVASSVVEDAIAKRKARSISLQGAALRRARNLTAVTADHWGPHVDRNSWALEIGVDLFAAWILGPVYGAAFLEVISSSPLDLFKIDRNHPPYAIRTRALEEAMRRLHWQNMADQLAEQMSCWRGQRADGRTVATEMSSGELLNSLVYRTLEFFDRCNLPRSTENDLADARLHFSDISRIEFGRTLLLCAHVAQESLPEGEFIDWHDRVVTNLAAQLTQ